MKFNDFQREHVVTLKTGQAAIYGLDTEEPVLVQAPNFWQVWEAQGVPVDSEPVGDAMLVERMARLKRQFAAYYFPYPGLKLYPTCVTGRDHAEALVNDKSLRLMERFIRFMAELDPAIGADAAMEQILDLVEDMVRQHASETLVGERFKATVYCLFLFLKTESGLFEEDERLTWEKNFRIMQETRNG